MAPPQIGHRDILPMLLAWGPSASATVSSLPGVLPCAAAAWFAMYHFLQAPGYMRIIWPTASSTETGHVGVASSVVRQALSLHQVHHAKDDLYALIACLEASRLILERGYPLMILSWFAPKKRIIPFYFSNRYCYYYKRRLVFGSTKK